MLRYLLCATLVLIVSISIIHADETQTRLDEIVNDFVEDDNALTVYLATPDGEWSVATGMARENQPTTIQDRFRIGSMSKTYVAVVALMLVEDGVFALDDLASQWLSDDILQNVANTNVVTIRQLLAMRTGIDDYLDTDGFYDAMVADTQYAWTAEEVLTYAYGLPTLFAPDTEFNYSNSNYILLQIILEKATGKGLHSLIRERILEPLDMQNTYTQVSETLPDGFVDSYGYFNDETTRINLSEINDGAGLGDGGLIANATDVYAFYKALLQDKTLLSQAMMDTLLDFTLEDDASGYSLGLEQWQAPLGVAWGHTGGVTGFASVGAYLPEADIIIIILGANEDLDLDELALNIVGEMLG
jgi:D-alanyl-D-alanine carboxypeptidase